eukprot:6205328-Pleurochrysis_carterae.AAC.1
MSLCAHSGLDYADLTGAKIENTQFIESYLIGVNAAQAGNGFRTLLGSAMCWSESHAEGVFRFACLYCSHEYSYVGTGTHRKAVIVLQSSLSCLDLSPSLTLSLGGNILALIV